MALEEKNLRRGRRTTKVSMIYLLGTMHVRTNFNDNPFNSYCDISAWTMSAGWIQGRPISNWT